MRYLMLRLYRVNRTAPQETGALEMALGVFGLLWGILSLGVVDNYGFIICTLPLLLLSVPQILAAHKPQLRARFTLAGLSALVWLSITVEALLRVTLSWDSLRGMGAYVWVTGIAGYAYANLYGRLIGAPVPTVEARKGIVEEVSKGEL